MKLEGVQHGFIGFSLPELVQVVTNLRAVKMT